MGEDVDRRAERWPATPPALPVRIVGERVRVEHGRAQDLDSNALEGRGCKAVADAGRDADVGVAEGALADRPGRGIGCRATPQASPLGWSGEA